MTIHDTCSLNKDLGATHIRVSCSLSECVSTPASLLVGKFKIQSRDPKTRYIQFCILKALLIHDLQFPMFLVGSYGCEPIWVAISYTFLLCLKCPPLHLVFCNHFFHRNLLYWVWVKQQVKSISSDTDIISSCFKLTTADGLFSSLRVGNASLKTIIHMKWGLSKNVLPIIFIPILMRNGNPKRRTSITSVHHIHHIEKPFLIKEIVDSLFISGTVHPDERQCKIIWIIAAIGQSELKSLYMTLASLR